MEQGMPGPDQCIFCKIVKGEIQSMRVYEDDQCMAILDINPATRGHLLLIPKEHYAFMPQMPEELVAHMGQVSKWLANSARKLFAASGVSIFAATGGIAGQNAPHVIIHMIPRFENDGVALQLQNKPVPIEQLQKIKQAIAPAIKESFGYENISPVQQPKSPESSEKAQPDKNEAQKVVQPPPSADLDAVSNFFGGNG